MCNAHELEFHDSRENRGESILNCVASNCVKVRFNPNCFLSHKIKDITREIILRMHIPIQHLNSLYQIGNFLCVRRHH